MQLRIRSRGAVLWTAIAAASVVALAGALPAAAVDPDVTAPVINAATLTPTAADGNSSWRRTTPTLNLSATDETQVDKLQYSLDAGGTYLDAPITPGTSVSSSVPVSQQGNTSVRYRAIDSSGNFSPSNATATTLSVAATAAQTGIRVASTTGRVAGERLVLGTGANQEQVTIASIPSPAPASPNPNILLTAPLAQSHAIPAQNQVFATFRTITVQIDNLAPVPVWGSSATTLAAAAAAGDTGVRLASTTGRAAGDVLQIDQLGAAETATIASIVTPAPAAPAPNVTLTAPLTNAHPTAAPVFLPAIVSDKILQSRTLTPTLTDPRRQFAGDTANGSGGSAYWSMDVDGAHSVPRATPLNLLTTGLHAQALTIQDTAGNRITYTRKFVVTTSFADLDTVLQQYAGNALSTTLATATVVDPIKGGATGLRLTSPFGFRAGQTILVGPAGPTQETRTITSVLKPPPTLNTTLVNAAPAGTTDIRIAANTVSGGTPVIVAGAPFVIDSGAKQEVVTASALANPNTTAPAPNLTLSKPLVFDHPAGTATTLVNVLLDTPLAQAHATGAATPIVNPRPLVDPTIAANLRSILATAATAAGADHTDDALDALHTFKNTALTQIKPVSSNAAVRNALVSSANSLVDQVLGRTVDTSGAGTTTNAEPPLIRQFTDPHPFVHNPLATYRILVNGRSGTNGSFRHEDIVDTEALIQRLGEQNGFDVDIWDPNIGGSPGRQAPAGVSLATSPFLDLNQLMQYKAIVFMSTVGREAGASLPTTSPTEFANFQSYIRAGGGFVAIHGATDAYQAVPWYMDLVGAGFTNHGSNSTGGIMPDCGACGEVRVTNADPGNVTTASVPASFYIHDELYNYNRDPTELGIVHPLLMEDESTLVGQLNYSPGPLMNTDRHAMAWCRNFDGGRSFVTEFDHSWELLTQDWFVQNLLKGIQTTAGVVTGNCVTFNEVSDLVASSLASGGINTAGAAALAGPLNDAKTQYLAGDYTRAASFANLFVKQTERSAYCKNADKVCPDGGAALAKLHAKGLELIDWMDGL
jgi:type 1 glutamine amidotransferase